MCQNHSLVMLQGECKPLDIMIVKVKKSLKITVISKSNKLKYSFGHDQ